MNCCLYNGFRCFRVDGTTGRRPLDRGPYKPPNFWDPCAIYSEVTVSPRSPRRIWPRRSEACEPGRQTGRLHFGSASEASHPFRHPSSWPAIGCSSPHVLADLRSCFKDAPTLLLKNGDAPCVAEPCRCGAGQRYKVHDVQCIQLFCYLETHILFLGHWVTRILYLQLIPASHHSVIFRECEV